MRAWAVRTSWVRQGDIDILMMGEVPAGRLHANAKAWILNLNYPASFWKTERSVEAARAALIIAFGDWLRRAGIEGAQGDLFG